MIIKAVFYFATAFLQGDALERSPAAARTFVETRCFLCAYREFVPYIFFVILGQAQHDPGIHGCPGQART